MKMKKRNLKDEGQLLEDFLNKVTPKGRVDHENHLTIIDDEDPPEDSEFWTNLYKETHPDAKV